jgi:hypothetical protein
VAQALKGTGSPWICIAATVLLAAADPAGAEGLLDPTLPPLVQSAAGAASPGVPAVAAAPAAARVQMILRGPGELRTALIDGQALHVGDRLDTGGGAAQVVRITDSTVELLRGSTRETLELVPGQAQVVRCARRGTATGIRPRGAPGSTDPC